jgi:hypothetical protein
MGSDFEAALGITNDAAPCPTPSSHACSLVHRYNSKRHRQYEDAGCGRPAAARTFGKLIKRGVANVWLPPPSEALDVTPKDGVIDASAESRRGADSSRTSTRPPRRGPRKQMIDGRIDVFDLTSDRRATPAARCSPCSDLIRLTDETYADAIQKETPPVSSTTTPPQEGKALPPLHTPRVPVKHLREFAKGHDQERQRSWRPEKTPRSSAGGQKPRDGNRG